MSKDREHYCIYLDKGLREVFDKEANRSSLIQSLLRAHYKACGVHVREFKTIFE